MVVLPVKVERAMSTVEASWFQIAPPEAKPPEARLPVNVLSSIVARVVAPERWIAPPVAEAVFCAKSTRRTVSWSAPRIAPPAASLPPRRVRFRILRSRPAT